MEALQRYVNKNCKYAGDLDNLFKLEKPTITSSIDISATDVSDPIKLLKWTKTAKAYIRREQTLEDNTRNIYSIIWGQCSLSLQAKIKQEKDFVDKDNNKECAWLLKQIKNAIFKFDSKMDPFLSWKHEPLWNIQGNKKNLKKSSTTRSADMSKYLIILVEISVTMRDS